MKIEVGLKLYLVPSHRHGHPAIVEVGKVGRKWATLVPEYAGRFDINTLQLDGKGYSSPGMLYQSKDVYDEMVLLDNYWKENVTNKLRDIYHRPGHINLTDMDKLISILSGAVR